MLVDFMTVVFELKIVDKIRVLIVHILVRPS